MKALKFALAALTLASVGLAQAGPVALTEGQLDHVSAGGLALASAGSFTLGRLVSVTDANTYTKSIGNDFALGTASSTGIAVSNHHSPAISGSTASTFATLH